jgi:hypothetical protein
MHPLKLVEVDGIQPSVKRPNAGRWFRDVRSMVGFTVGILWHQLTPLK